MDNIFEGFEYCGAWYKNMKIGYANKEFDVEVQINGYDEEEIPENGKEALLSFLGDKDNTVITVLEGIFEYYRDRREELGYDEEDNEEYPDYSDCKELLDTLQLIGITVPDQDDYSERAIFLVFNCDWDEENGVGVCLIGNVVDEVGEQGIAL